MGMNKETDDNKARDKAPESNTTHSDISTDANLIDRDANQAIASMKTSQDTSSKHLSPVEISDDDKTHSTAQLNSSRQTEAGDPTNKETPTNSGRKCAGGFEKTLGFNVTLESLSTETNNLKSSPGLERREEHVEQAIYDLARMADASCDGKLSRAELNAFQLQDQVSPATRDLAQHLLNNFDRFAQFSGKAKESEIKDPLGRKIADEVLKDNSPDNVISVEDLDGIKAFSPMVIFFTQMNIADRLIPELKNVPQQSQAQMVNELSNFFTGKMAERKDLLSWK